MAVITSCPRHRFRACTSPSHNDIYTSIGHEQRLGQLLTWQGYRRSASTQHTKTPSMYHSYLSSAFSTPFYPLLSYPDIVDDVGKLQSCASTPQPSSNIVKPQRLTDAMDMLSGAGRYTWKGISEEICVGRRWMENMALVGSDVIQYSARLPIGYRLRRVCRRTYECGCAY
jgi:hypothetical protein